MINHSVGNLAMGWIEREATNCLNGMHVFEVILYQHEAAYFWEIDIFEKLALL